MTKDLSKDEKIIRKQYGEKMWHFCRDNFPTILEKEGVLSSILLETFAPNHTLYEDILYREETDQFKRYINSKNEPEEEEKNIKRTVTTKTAKQLMDEAGYILYECMSEADIQSFKKYYSKKEMLCTFIGGRLNRCHVFFAVKKDALDIKREDFPNPKRQDLYGTSVISIQFTKDDSHKLSIKNRYNHTAKNPDATFSNNLDNIIPGLTTAFFQDYQLLDLDSLSESPYLPDYVMATDDRYYKTNIEYNNIYYCPNNVIIDNFVATQTNLYKTLLLDCFIIDLEEKIIRLYDESQKDSFIATIGDINDISIEKNSNGKQIKINPKEGTEILIEIDKNNRIIGLKNENVTEIGDNFLCRSEYLKEVSLPNVETVGDNFLELSYKLETLFMPKLETVGESFLQFHENRQKFLPPKVNKDKKTR